MDENKIKLCFVEIHGIVTPCAWSNDEKVTAISIAADDENEYFVQMTGKGKDLLGMVRKSIYVTGAFTCNAQGRKILTVKDYQVRF